LSYKQAQECHNMKLTKTKLKKLIKEELSEMARRTEGQPLSKEQNDQIRDVMLEALRGEYSASQYSYIQETLAHFAELYGMLEEYSLGSVNMKQLLKSVSDDKVYKIISGKELTY